MPNEVTDKIDKIEAAMSGLGSVIGGLMTAFNAAAAELAELKKDLTANPTIDSSASDAEAAATAADMPPE